MEEIKLLKFFKKNEEKNILLNDICSQYFLELEKKLNEIF